MSVRFSCNGKWWRRGRCLFFKTFFLIWLFRLRRERHRCLNFNPLKLLLLDQFLIVWTPSWATYRVCWLFVKIIDSLGERVDSALRGVCTCHFFFNLQLKPFKEINGVYIVLTRSTPLWKLSVNLCLCVLISSAVPITHKTSRDELSGLALRGDQISFVVVIVAFKRENVASSLWRILVVTLDWLTALVFITIQIKALAHVIFSLWARWEELSV